MIQLVRSSAEHLPRHGTAGALQHYLERLQGALALLGDAAQLQAAVGAGGDSAGSVSQATHWTLEAG